MELVTLTNFLYIPLGIFLSLYCLNLYLFFQKRNEQIGTSNKIPMNQMMTYFLIFFGLLLTPIIYNYIAYEQLLQSENLVVSVMDVYIYLGLSMLGIIAQAIVFYLFINKVESKRISFFLTSAILGIAIAESLNIIALIIIFQKLNL